MPEQKAVGGRLQSAVIVLLIATFILIAQPFSFTVYQWGFVVLFATTVVQIAVGNVGPGASWGAVLRALGITLAILTVMVGVGIYLTPYLIHMGGVSP